MSSMSLVCQRKLRPALIACSCTRTRLAGAHAECHIHNLSSTISRRRVASRRYGGPNFVSRCCSSAATRQARKPSSALVHLNFSLTNDIELAHGIYRSLLIIFGSGVAFFVATGAVSVECTELGLSIPTDHLERDRYLRMTASFDEQFPLNEHFFSASQRTTLLRRWCRLFSDLRLKRIDTWTTGTSTIPSQVFSVYSSPTKLHVLGAY